jgi:hypothetical protein
LSTRIHRCNHGGIGLIIETDSGKRGNSRELTSEASYIGAVRTGRALFQDIGLGSGDGFTTLRRHRAGLRNADGQLYGRVQPDIVIQEYILIDGAASPINHGHVAEAYRCIGSQVRQRCSHGRQERNVAISFRVREGFLTVEDRQGDVIECLDELLFNSVDTLQKRMISIANGHEKGHLRVQVVNGRLDLADLLNEVDGRNQVRVENALLKQLKSIRYGGLIMMDRLHSVGQVLLKLGGGRNASLINRLEVRCGDIDELVQLVLGQSDLGCSCFGLRFGGG